MNLYGIVTAVATFIIIGLFHPLVIKAEYHLGTGCWWIFFIAGLLFIVGSLLTSLQIASIIMGVVGCSCFWSILELFQQKKRVEKGWFPKNPKRK